MVARKDTSVSLLALGSLCLFFFFTEFLPVICSSNYTFLICKSVHPYACSFLFLSAEAPSSSTIFSFNFVGMYSVVSAGMF